MPPFVAPIHWYGECAWMVSTGWNRSSRVHHRARLGRFQAKAVAVRVDVVGGATCVRGEPIRVDRRHQPDAEGRRRLRRGSLARTTRARTRRRAPGRAPGPAARRRAPVLGPDRPTLRAGADLLVLRRRPTPVSLRYPIAPSVIVSQRPDRNVAVADAIGSRSRRRRDVAGRGRGRRASRRRSSWSCWRSTPLATSTSTWSSARSASSVPSCRSRPAASIDAHDRRAHDEQRSDTARELRRRHPRMRSA